MTIKFYRVNEEYGCFSNFYKANFELDGKLWNTVEHYFQARKFDGHPEIQQEIRDTKWAGMAWKLANRKYKDIFDYDRWMKIRDEVMYLALTAKFFQNPDIARTLCDTGDEILVEHTENDNYWADGGDGTGENKLGKYLVQVREELSKAKK